MTARRLAAILAADVVGYSRLIGADEAGTLARLRALRGEVVDPLVSENGGRVFKTTGDGWLAEFPSTVQALRCAIGVQERLRRGAMQGQLQVRVGVHQGDVVVEGDDLLGDGVNVAARLEGLAEPGGICISGRVREDAAGKLSLEVEDLGEPELKNIAQRHRVFRVLLSGAAERPALALPDKPSLAVLPFQNMSGDPEQEYFADGMVEDITTALSRVGGLFVIARNSSFTYKGRAVDVRQVGRELGVRYVLEGSVRKAGRRVRITCQLVNAFTGAHIWADRFDSDFEDIFELQDRITESVAGAIEPTLRKAEIERALNKPTESLDAYDLYLRALYHHDQIARDNFEEALRILRQAIALDGSFALAKALAAWCGGMMVNFNWWIRDTPDVAEAVELARSALATARDDPATLSYAGFAIAYLRLDNAAGRAALDRALALNPNSSNALMSSGYIHLYAGAYATARDEFVRAMRISPLDPQMPFFLGGLGMALTELGQAEEGRDLLLKSIAIGQGAAFALSSLVHCLVQCGRMDEARQMARAYMEAYPEGSLSRIRKQQVHWNSSYVAQKLASLRAAGIPE